MIRVKHYALLGHATRGDSYPSIKRYTEYHLWLQCQLYALVAQNQTHMPDRGFEV